MLNGVPRPDHGDGWRERVCQHCDAGWVGHETDGDEWCPWCERRYELEAEMRRRELLDPPHLRTDAGTARYDALSDLDRAVWDRTRGQMRGEDTVLRWIEQLARACKDGIITHDEMAAAIRKVAK